MNMEDGDVKKVNEQWFMYLEFFGECDKCDGEFNQNSWINIQKAVDNINSKPQVSEKSDNNRKPQSVSDVCPLCNGKGYRKGGIKVKYS